MRLSWIDPAMNLQPNVGYHVKFEKDNNWQYFNVTKRTYLIVKDLRPGMTYTFYAKKNNEPNYISVSNATREEGRTLFFSTICSLEFLHFTFFVIFHG
jgi:hypothetical protein